MPHAHTASDASGWSPATPELLLSKSRPCWADGLFLSSLYMSLYLCIPSFVDDSPEHIDDSPRRRQRGSAITRESIGDVGYRAPGSIRFGNPGHDV